MSFDPSVVAEKEEHELSPPVPEGSPRDDDDLELEVFSDEDRLVFMHEDSICLHR